MLETAIFPLFIALLVIFGLIFAAMSIENLALRVENKKLRDFIKKFDHDGNGRPGGSKRRHF